MFLLVFLLLYYHYSLLASADQAAPSVNHGSFPEDTHNLHLEIWSPLLSYIMADQQETLTQAESKYQQALLPADEVPSEWGTSALRSEFISS